MTNGLIDRFSLNPEPPTAGQPVEICYTNENMGEGEEVTIEIDNGQGDNRTLKVTIDANGKGCGNFDVPAGWTSISLNHPTSLEHTSAVN